MELSPSTANAVQTRNFLRLCLCSHWDAEATAMVSKIIAAGGINWASIVKAAQTARVAPLVYATLCDQPHVPRDVLVSLQAWHNLTLRYNLNLLAELQRVLRRLQAQNVPVIILKGAALAQVVYPNIALRVLRDLDLLVPQTAVPQVANALHALGFHAPRVETRAGAALNYESQLLLSKTTPLVCQIEIHWNLIDSPFYQRRITTEWFWQTTLPCTVGNVPARMLGPEAQTLYLCAHLLLHHGGSDLLWLNDVARVIRFYQARMNWAELLTQAKSLGLALAAQKILLQVAQEWGAPIPADVIAKLQRLEIPTEEARVARALIAPRRSAGQQLWIDLQSIPDWRARAAFALLNLFPSRAYMRQRYRVAHPFLVVLAYPYRWWLGARNRISGQ